MKFKMSKKVVAVGEGPCSESVELHLSNLLKEAHKSPRAKQDSEGTQIGLVPAINSSVAYSFVCILLHAIGCTEQGPHMV